MATFKEALTTSLTNFAKSIAKTYPKTANIVDNLLSTDSTLPLSAKQGNVLQTQIDTLNSNMKVSPKGLKHISQNIAISGVQTNTVTLEEGGYLIFQTHPTGQKAVYFVACMNGYTGKIIPIANDTQSTWSIDNACNLSVTLKNTGAENETNFRWWHIVKMCGLENLGV